MRWVYFDPDNWKTSADLAVLSRQAKVWFHCSASDRNAQHSPLFSDFNRNWVAYALASKRRELRSKTLKWKSLLTVAMHYSWKRGTSSNPSLRNGKVCKTNTAGFLFVMPFLWKNLERGRHCPNNAMVSDVIYCKVIFFDLSGHCFQELQQVSALGHRQVGLYNIFWPSSKYFSLLFIGL